jgi:hypothetical protein
MRDDDGSIIEEYHGARISLTIGNTFVQLRHYDGDAEIHVLQADPGLNLFSLEMGHIEQWCYAHGYAVVVLQGEDGPMPLSLARAKSVNACIDKQKGYACPMCGTKTCALETSVCAGCKRSISR